MAHSNHNKYVSFPDWFGSLSSVDSTTLPSTTVVTSYAGSGTGGTGGTTSPGLTGVTVTGSGNAVTSGTLNGSTLVLNKELTFLTEGNQSLWELRSTTDGKQYLYANYDIATLGGLTMYTDNGDIDLPGLYDGIPIDNISIYWGTDENGNKVLKSIGTGSEGGVADKIAWANVYNKPSWITNDKPVYNYSEIQNTPNLNQYVTIDNYQEINGVKNFLNGFQIAGLPVYKLDGYLDVIYIDANLVVRGGVTMYGVDNITIDSIIDALPPASTSSFGVAKFHPDDFIIDGDGFVKLVQQSGGESGTTDLPIASTSTKGIAQFNAQSFTVDSGIVDLKTKILVVNSTPSSFDNNTLYIII